MNVSQGSYSAAGVPNESSKVWAVRFLLFIAGLGGLLYGIDVGIIAGALPYLEATSGLNAQQLSFIVAAVLLGSVISTLFAGLLADWMGRKKLMAISAALFVASIPMIALAQGYAPLVLGRLLQGISAGLIGVVVPLYLAECLVASQRGKGTAIFQWLLTLGIVVAAVIGYCFSLWVNEIEKLNDADKLFAFKNIAWRSIFWVSLPPGLLFFVGSLLVPESSRWLFRRGKKQAALNALLRSRTREQAEIEMREMEETLAAEQAKTSTTGEKIKESLLHRKYVIPFILACIVLACTQLTGVNSVISYNTTILIQAGLDDAQAHLGYVILTVVNFLMTMVAIALVDRKGRKFLLSLGSAGIIVSLVCTGLLFQNTEKRRVDCSTAVQAMVADDQKLDITFDAEHAYKLLSDQGWDGKTIGDNSYNLIVIYSFGDFRAATKVVRSNDKKPEIEITRESCVPANKVAAFFSNPFADLDAARFAPLKIENALITPVPSAKSGWLIALCIYCFMACFAAGPGVCVWLALSELMPTRIRSNGMSFALLINQAVSTSIAAVFLPTVGKYGYSTMFFAFAGFTVIYFITAFFFLPETKGKTLEEIEEHFSGQKKFQHG
jgi:MFS transporter, SP family, solute carrier family 2 (myo-inositol transporter), member 13